MKLLVFIIPIWLIGEIYFYSKIQQSIAKEAAIMYVGDQTLQEKIPSLANGKLSAKQPAILYDLVDKHQEALILSFHAEIYQLVKINTSYNASNKRQTYKNVGRFVTKDSEEWDNRVATESNNYETWPIKYQSCFVYGKDFWFRDTLKLDEATIVDEFQYYESWDSSLEPIYFLAPKTLANKALHIKEKDTSSVFPQPDLSYQYYYGQYPDKPQIGDIRLVLRGFLTKHQESEKDSYRYSLPKEYALLGTKENNTSFGPYMNKYVLWNMPRSERDFEQDLEFISRHYSDMQSSFKWVFRVLLGLLVVALLFSK